MSYAPPPPPSKIPGASTTQPSDAAKLTPDLIPRFRGATVADLDLPPALSITPSTPLPTALAMSYDRDYDHLTVTSSSTRKLLGYLCLPQIRAKLESGEIPDEGQGLKVKDVMSRFRNRESGKGYTVITPDTELQELYQFFEREGGDDFAVVTDEGRRWVVGVATRADLVGFASRRPS